MAQINTGILGGFSGKVGTVIGYCMNGVAYMRGLALSHTDANTLAQQDQRAKFSLVIAFLRPLIGLIRLGFDDASSLMSGFASAVSYTLKNAITGVSPLFALDYTKILLGRGDLPPAYNGAVVSVAPGTIDFSWDNNSWEPGALATDLVVIAMYDGILKKGISKIGAGTRATGSQSLVVPDIFQGNQVQCWIGFQDAKGDFSNVEWAGAVNVAA